MARCYVWRALDR